MHLNNRATSRFANKGGQDEEGEEGKGENEEGGVVRWGVEA